MNGDWKPLSIRESGKPAALREGVPDGLERPLRAWIERWATSLSDEVIERLGVVLDIDLDDFWSNEALYERLASVPLGDRLLEVADAVLYSLTTFEERVLSSSGTTPTACRVGETR